MTNPTAQSSHTIRTAAALIIGNELLNGKTNEQNVVVLARTLRALGISLLRVVVVPDEVPTIADEVRYLSSRYDMVFTSGGVGPTHDDVTIEAVAEAFNTHVETHEPGAEAIRRHFGENLRPEHLIMARIPHGCSLVAHDDSGWHTIHMHNVWVLPGVPEVFCARLLSIKKHLPSGQPFVCREVYTRLDEGTIVPLLNHIVEQFPDVSVGSYPTWNHPCYETKLTFDGIDATAVERACQAFIQLLPDDEPLRVDGDSIAQHSPAKFP